MSLLPEQASFEEQVADCFIAFRGTGLMLSALDAELLEQWREAGVPYEVVARGIARAAERALWDARPGEPVIRSLRACKRHVEVEIEKHKARSVGGRAAADQQEDEAPPRSLPEERHARMKSALRKIAREHLLLADAVERLLGGLLEDPPEDLPRAVAREERVMAALLRGLPFAERLAVLKEARARWGTEEAAMSGRARRLSRRFHNAAILRKTFSLPAFW